MIAISAKENLGIDVLEETITEMFSMERFHLTMKYILLTLDIKTH